MSLRALLMLIAASTTGATAAVPRPESADPREVAYEAKTLSEAQTLLGVRDPEPGRRLRLEVPDIVDGSVGAGARVRIKVTSLIPGTDWIAVFVNRGPKPLITFRDFPPGDEHELAVTFQLPQTASIRAVARAGGKYYQVAREVKVAHKPPPAP